MPFGAIILTRILLAASIVFVIGYVFGNFSKSPVLTTITKVVVILATLLFIAANIFLFRFGNSNRGLHGERSACWRPQQDSVQRK